MRPAFGFTLTTSKISTILVQICPRCLLNHESSVSRSWIRQPFILRLRQIEWRSNEILSSFYTLYSQINSTYVLSISSLIEFLHSRRHPFGRSDGANPVSLFFLFQSSSNLKWSSYTLKMSSNRLNSGKRSFLYYISSLSMILNAVTSCSG